MLSGNYAILQVFYEISCGSSSIPYASVPARLQYGCSNFSAPRSMLRHCLSECSVVYYRVGSNPRLPDGKQSTTSPSTSRGATRLRIV
jgi:hypothetical protein